MDDFCIDCGIKIVKPSMLDMFAGNQPKAKEFKDGWMCGNCYQKSVRK